MNNKYEVGNEHVENYDNATRLNGSVNPAPTMGQSSDYATTPTLDVKTTGGVVGTPTIGGDYVPVPQKSADVTNSSTSLNTTYDHINLGAKWGYPNVSQDIPEKGRGQFEDHT